MSRYIVCPHPQGSEEWLRDRAGKATGSNAKCILAKIKSGEAAARRDYRTDIVTERLTGAPAPQGFVSNEMKWGTEQEPFARMAYEEKTGAIVSEAGFVYLPDLAAGCSVDGFVRSEGVEGIIEIKCPKTATHIGYLLSRCMPSEHLAQVVHNLWVTGAQWCDFVSYDPRLPGPLQLLVIRVTADAATIKNHEAEVLAFLKECDELEAELKQLLEAA